MKGERGRRHKELDRSVVAREPLHDEIEIQLEVGRAILFLHGGETKPMHVTVVPGEAVKIRCGPAVAHPPGPPVRMNPAQLASSSAPSSNEAGFGSSRL